MPRSTSPLRSVELSKKHKKLAQYYEEISQQRVDETLFFATYIAKEKKSGEYRSIRVVPKKSAKTGALIKEAQRFQEQVCHPNVVHLYEILEDRKYYYFVTDRVDYPNIYQVLPRIYTNPADFDESRVALLVRTILRALRHCHKLGFAHTNLSYSNILVDPEKGEKKLCIHGFGYARMKEIVLETDCVEDWSSSSIDGDDVAPEDMFAAPETRAGDLSLFETPSDIWSVGIITFQLLTLHHPFEDPEVRPFRFQDKAWTEDFFHNHLFLTNVSAPARDFLKHLLTYTVSQRPTADQALGHEWLKGVDGIENRGKKEALLDSLDNLTTFDAQNKLEMVARLYIADNFLCSFEKVSLLNIFKHLDRDKDNALTKEEIYRAFEKAHGENQQVKVVKALEKTFDQIDVDKNGIIDRVEFMAAAAKESLLLRKKNLRKTFDAFDKSNTGTITKDDIKQICADEQVSKIISRRDIRRIMKEADLNGDGEIDFEEFCELMRRK